jgi:glycosyltransferase involved in cell wall biosynthesis
VPWNTGTFLLRRLRFDVGESAKAHLRRFWKARQLTAVRVRPSLADARTVAVMAVRNEAERFPHLLSYYRALGVDHFLVVDNQSTDGLQELLAGEHDVSSYLARGQFRQARYANDWVNHLLSRHCSGKWVLYVDADELFVFAGGRASGLRELCHALQRRGQRAVQSILLDMYSERQASKNVVAPGDDPLEVCRYYDATGYEYLTDEFSLTTWIKGGVRGRLFFEGDLWAGPALNKTPLVHWRRHYAFLKSAHELWPRRLNRQSTTAQSALLHVKYTSFSVAKVTHPGHRAQHTTEYDAYDELHGTLFTSAATREYRGADGLVEDGLITPVLTD